MNLTLSDPKTYDDYLPNLGFQLLHTSTPNMKMFYPEPFIATPSFVSDDIWFLHITIYQYWLWFIFISLIVFFFLGFLITLRWCNVRHRPVRETRGVSRSKCGDLITALVPVSWAASIIIHESTDAIEINDGFGSTDVAVGIRAYQWGWEYYYPKNQSLMLKSDDFHIMGNSIQTYTGFGQTTVRDSLKSWHTNTDFINTTYTNRSAQLLSLASGDSLPETLSSFGPNKLLARCSADLVNSTDVLRVDSLMKMNQAAGTSEINTLSQLEPSQYLPSTLIWTNHQLEGFTSWANFAQSNYSTTLNNPLLRIHSYADVKTHIDARTLTGFELAKIGAYNTLFNLYPLADQDFKRWAAFDLLEDSQFYELTPVEDFFKSGAIVEFEKIHHCLNLDAVHNYNYVLASTISENVYPFFNTTNSIFDSTHDIYSKNAITNLVLKDWYKKNEHLVNISNFTMTHSLLNAINLSTSLHINLNLFFFEAGAIVSSFASSREYLFREHAFTKSVQMLCELSSNWSGLFTYNNAFAKIFKATFDEQRGFDNYANFSNLTQPLPPLDSNSPSRLNLIQKNRSNLFLKSLLYKNNIHLSRSLVEIAPDLSSWLKFPFTVAFESDSIRYIWFDWYSLRNSIVTKALDTSVFNLNASRNYDYTFVDSLEASKLTNTLENYFLKYSNARKFYLQSTTYEPFFYKTWLKNTQMLSNFEVTSGSNFTSFFELSAHTLVNLPLNDDFDLSWTTTQSGQRPYKSTLNVSLNQTEMQLTVSDIITRRSLLTSYLFKSTVGGGKLESTATSNLYLPTSNTLKNFNKSQYQPLRKGIVNMVRIQADKAVAFPTDTRLQILAVSKDIIHSWSIPAAGIKIDCIPGYSSHRVAVFTLSGIYWGQCMEICGRFHHWMPIVVYFIRRDLFCLWCVHFIFKNNQTQGTLQSYDMTNLDTSLTLNKLTTVPSTWQYLFN